MRNEIAKSRAEAKAIGAKHYFTGKPCPNGHNTIRFTSTGGCNECLKRKARNYNREHKESRAAYKQEWRAENAEHVRQYERAYHAETYHQRRERRIEYLRRHYRENKWWYKEYAQKNKRRNAETARRRHKIRSRRDPDYRAARDIRSLLTRTLSLAGRSKHSRTEEMIGYSARDLRVHLERQFSKGMGWHNRSEWHIDHITPIAWFIENGITDPRRINCLSNLKPVWASENLSKNARQTHLI